MSKQIRISDEAYAKIEAKRGRLSFIGFIDELVIDNNFNEPKLLLEK